MTAAHKNVTPTSPNACSAKLALMSAASDTCVMASGAQHVQQVPLAGLACDAELAIREFAADDVWQRAAALFVGNVQRAENRNERTRHINSDYVLPGQKLSTSSATTA